MANSSVNLGANKTLTLSNAGDTYAGIINGTGTSGLTLTAGTQTLSGANTYSGDTRLNTQLIGVLFGIMAIGLIGRLALRGIRAADDVRAAAVAVLPGLALMAIEPPKIEFHLPRVCGLEVSDLELDRDEPPHASM